MNRQVKMFYEAPTTEVVEMQMQGGLCIASLLLILDQTSEDDGSFGDQWQWNQ